MIDDVLDRIQTRLKALNLTASAASLRAGLSRDAIRNMQRTVRTGARSGVSTNTVAALARALEVSPSWLLTGTEDLAQTAAPQIPVYGLAAGAFNGLSRMDADPVEWLDCPPALARVKGAYALIVKGGSMEPRFQNGDLVFINPNRPPRPGDDIIIQVQVHAQAPTETWIKRLLREEAETLTVRQFNPLAEMTFKRAHVKALHRVLTVNELFG